MDIQTFKENIVDHINSSNDDELKRKYIEYEAKRHPDYSHINFKALFIEMIAEEASQTDMAIKYGIPPRTISRELAKLENDEEYKKYIGNGSFHAPSLFGCIFVYREK